MDGETPAEAAARLVQGACTAMRLSMESFATQVSREFSTIASLTSPLHIVTISPFLI